MKNQAHALEAGNSGFLLKIGSLALLALLLSVVLYNYLAVPAQLSQVIIKNSDEVDLGEWANIEPNSTEAFNWTGIQHRNGCPGWALDHLLCHKKGSKSRKSQFLNQSPQKIYDLVESAGILIQNGRYTLIGTVTIHGRQVTKVVVDMGRTVGTNAGRATRYLQVYYEQGVRPVLHTAFPTSAPPF